MMRSGCLLYRKHVVGVDRDDVEAVGVEGADAGSAAAGYGRYVSKILFKGKGLPPEGMLDGFGVNAGSVETDAGAHLKGVGGPMG